MTDLVYELSTLSGSDLDYFFLSFFFIGLHGACCKACPLRGNDLLQLPSVLQKVNSEQDGGNLRVQKKQKL